MPSRDDVNVLAGRVLRRLMQDRPDLAAPIIRTAVAVTKVRGTSRARATLRAILREFYRDTHRGDDPVGRHQFVHWMRDLPLRTDPTDPVQGVDRRDAFEATPDDIT